MVGVLVYILVGPREAAQTVRLILKLQLELAQLAELLGVLQERGLQRDDSLGHVQDVGGAGQVRQRGDPLHMQAPEHQLPVPAARRPAARPIPPSARAAFPHACDSRPSAS